MADQQVTNPKLIEAIEAMRADFKPETQNATINAALRSTFYVPAIIEKKKEIVANENNEVKFEEKPKARFLLIKKNGDDGQTFFPAFTDADELAKFKANEPYQRVKMKFGDLAMLVEQVTTISGFVINPMSHNLPFTREMLEGIKQVLIKRRNEQQKQTEAASGESAAEE